MNNAMQLETFTVDEALGAMTIAPEIKYRWEREFLAALASGPVPATASGYAVLGENVLDLWQVQRFSKKGLITRNTKYCDMIPQSQFDAPAVRDDYTLTALGRAVAVLLG